MVRLCLSIFACFAAAFGSFGCSGQNIEGAWLGPLPVEDAKACRIKIYSDHKFDVACGNLTWAGAGRYERDGTNLMLIFAAWVHKGEVQKQKPVIRLSFEGHGNTMNVGEIDDPKKPFVWRREAR